MGLKTSTLYKSENLTELCEGLLSSAWTLVNFVHGRAMGFSETCQNVSDREAILRSEKVSLEVSATISSCVFLLNTMQFAKRPAALVF